MFKQNQNFLRLCNKHVPNANRILLKFTFNLLQSKFFIIFYQSCLKRNIFLDEMTFNMGLSKIFHI